MIILDSKLRGNLSLYLKDNTEKGSNIYISSPFFTLFAFNELKELINKKLREKGLTEFEYELNFKNGLNQQSIAQICLDYIKMMRTYLPTKRTH